MKNETLYNKTVDILVQAYLNDTLKHGNCCACAVGNIIAGNLEEIMVKDALGDVSWSLEEPHWTSVFYTANSGGQMQFSENYVGIAKTQIDSTGYTWKELAMLEFAFESTARRMDHDEWVFKSLMSVIFILDYIHENTDAAITEQVKARFQKV